MNGKNCQFSLVSSQGNDPINHGKFLAEKLSEIGFSFVFSFFAR
jgi:hypothetical protein